MTPVLASIENGTVEAVSANPKENTLLSPCKHNNNNALIVDPDNKKYSV